MSDHIPFEIQTEIIKRVPEVKSLIRFRPVSKPWMSFIDSFEFIAGYRPSKTQPHRSILRYKIDPYYVKYLLVNDNFTQRQDFTPNVSAPMKQSSDTVVIGSSRGLVCLYAFDKVMLVVWNPCIRRSVGIVAPCIFEVFGFMVCPVMNDPTVVKISFHGKFQVVIGRCIYRVAYEDIPLSDGRLRTRNMIVSFDLVAKEFRAIDLPANITDLFRGCVRVHVSKLSVSLVVIVPMRDVNVWKMEGDSSFTKLFTINAPDSSIRNILRFRKSGELVIATQEGYNPYLIFGEEKDFVLEVYDRFSQHMNNLETYGQPDSFFISSYKETLHLLDHLDSCVYPN